jgi:hypothetical protein
MPRPKQNHRKSTAPAPHARRAAGLYPYYRVAGWDDISFTWRDSPKPHESLPAAHRAGGKHTRYRITQINEDGGKAVIYTSP